MEKRISRPISVLVAVTGAVIGLLFLMASMAGTRTQAAPLGEGTGGDPRIESVAVTSDMPISDTRPGDGVSKIIYFNNLASGDVTATFAITGTPVLTFNAGVAFDESSSVYTSAVKPVTFTLVYAVESTHTMQSNVWYTATNSSGQQAGITLTFAQDVTGPVASIVSPPTGYFTGTQLVITGTAVDNSGGSGVRIVQVMTATTWGTATGTGTANWAYTTTVSAMDDATITLSARGTDYVSAVGVVDTRVITVDNVLPANPSVVTTTDGTPTGSWVNHNMIPVSWTAVSDGSGVTYYYVWDQSASTAVDSSDEYTTTTELTGTALAEGDNYFHIRSRDGAGNWASGTKHLGPLQVDTVSPTVGISTPVPGAVLTSATVVITGTSADATSAVAAVEVQTDTTWSAATDTDPWSYDWTLPSADNEVFTLTARATDGAGNVAVSAAVPVTVDTVLPANPSVVTTTDGTPTGSWVNHNTIPVSWTAVSDGSGVTYYYVWDQSASTAVDSSDAFTTATELTGTALAEGDNYFHIRSRDGVGNWASGTAHLGPLQVDTVSPTVSISTPAPGAVFTTTHQSTVAITGTSADATSAVAAVDVMTDTTWDATTGTDPWSYDWTLPSADNEVFTLTAKATDEAGNVAVSAAVLVTVDTVAPAATPPVPHRSPWVTSTVYYTWTEPSDDAGIARYQVNVTNTVGYSAFFWTSSPELTFTQANSEGDDYYARVRAVDAHGNVGDWSGHSAMVTPDLNPPDLSSPGIVIVSNDAMFVISGTSLFYTNTLGGGSFTVKGDAQDTLSGLDVATFSEAFGYTPGDDNNPAVYAQTYDAPAGATESGTIIVTVYDNAGNTSVQAFPYALDGTPPTSDALAPAIARDDIDVDWDADDAQSGVYSTTLWYKKEAAGTWMPDQTAKADSGTFTFAPSDGDGLYLFATIAVDNLGNLESGPTMSETQTLYDATGPTNVVFGVPDNSSTAVFTLSWSADDATSGVVLYTVEYRRTGDTVWTDWETTTDPATMPFTAPTMDTTYTFRLTVYDGAGNTALETGTTWVGDYKVYVPLVMNNYRLLANGNFDDGLNGWTTRRGPFPLNGRGTGMPQSVVWQGGSKQALLGDPNMANGDINVGYGSIEQTFVVDKRYLTLQYHVFTYDIVRGAETGRYFDTFEVSINRRPDQITDAHRNSRGCTTTRLNPTGTLVVPSSDGLVFCGGRSASSSVVGNLWNPGPRTVTLDMNAYLGEAVTLYFAIWSREYDSPYYNDRGWYNTWAYVDNVRLQETDSAGLHARTLQRPVAAPESLGSPAAAVVPGLATSGAGAWVAFGLGPRVMGMAGRLRGGAGKMRKLSRRRIGSMDKE